MERTLLIIKPDAVDRKLVGHVIGRLEKAGFKILAMRMEKLTEEKAREFYAVHRERPFYNDLVKYMTSGPVIPILLEKENAVTGLRELIGATDPAKAACGTLRQEIALDVQSNSVHASDAPETAAVETVFFFG
ncbi:MAG: nucleoside-diphosphate kinase [Candidatus Zixiibacteriota bacterium]|nr:MAG: nucleoside-diphosphate kinase [candidate division Zixibacteria bacterium]HDL04456.1 nucleoside-diphosphate kinase [candidate division Zixibacteria bacterium]